MEKQVIVTKEDCEKYERVRVSGVTNMFMVTYVCKLSGLDRDTILFIMENYNELNNKFGFRK